MPVIKVKSEEVKIKVPLTTLRIEPTTQTKTVEPSIEEQVITPDEGVFALSSVTVKSVTSSVDENIKPENIKQGVSILGVEGTVKSSDYNAKTIPITNKLNGNGSFVEYITELTEVNIGDNQTTLMRLFNGFKGLEKYTIIGDTSKVTSINGMHMSCNRLKKIPHTDTSKVTDFTQACYNCYDLEEFPDYDMSNVEKMSSMCFNCYDLKSVPAIPCGKVVTFAGAFNWCSLLTDVGGFIDLGKAYDPTQNENYSYYSVELTYTHQLTEQSAINILNGLYDIASLGVKPQRVQFRYEVINRMTSPEGQQAIANAQAKGWTVG